MNDNSKSLHFTLIVFEKISWIQINGINPRASSGHKFNIVLTLQQAAGNFKLKAPPHGITESIED
jgi:hypothetical protein